MAAPSTPPLPASADPTAPPVIESPEGARVTIGGRQYDWFRGNGYLGLQAHPDVLRAACEATLRYGLKLRDHRRVGCHPCVLEWEGAANSFFDCEAAVLLGLGYAGGAVMAAALGDDFDVAFVDEQSHANVWDGLAAAGVRVVSFPHRDPEGLAAVLSTDLGARQRPLVGSDGIFPITGAPAPVPDYEVVLQPYDGALLCLDDAHAYGVLGPDGRGTSDHFGLNGARRFPPLATTDADVPVAADVPRFIDAIAAGIWGILSRRRTDADQSDLATHLVPHSWSAVFARYESIYRELIERKPRLKHPADGGPGEVVGQVVGAAAPGRPPSPRHGARLRDPSGPLPRRSPSGGEEIADHPDACLHQQRAVHREPRIDARGRSVHRQTQTGLQKEGR